MITGELDINVVFWVSLFLVVFWVACKEANHGK